MPGEQLLLINPRRRKRRRANPVRHHRRASSRRRVANPRRRRHSVRAHIARSDRGHRYRVRRHMANPRRHHRARRRNPFLGGSLTQDVLMPAALGVVGGAALGLAWNSLSSNLPCSVTGNSVGALIGQGAGAIGLGWLAGKALGSRKGAAVAVGALVVVGYQFLEGSISGIALPSVTMCGVGLRIPGMGRMPRMGRMRRMGAYLPGQGLGRVGLRTGRGMGAYMPGQGLGAVSRFNPAPMMSGLGGTFCNTGMSDSMF
ncbi:MAG: hypothetical protein WBR29_03085 [Gammaproteobacteria bacterium]